MNVHCRAAPWVQYVLPRVQWYKSCSLWNAEESWDSQRLKKSVLSFNILLIWARPSHNNYQCLHEKPHATQQLTAILNQIWLQLECCLSDRPLLRLTSLAAWTCCLKRRNTQVFDLITFTFHQTAVWFDLLDLGIGLETWLTFSPSASYLM